MSKRKGRERVLPVVMQCPDGVTRLTWSRDVQFDNGEILTLTIARVYPAEDA